MTKHRIVFHRSCPSKTPGCRVHVYYDNERHKELVENYFRSRSDSEGNLPKELEDSLYESTKPFGMSILLTNADSAAKEVYHAYKTRWDIEEMFDHHKNTLGFDMGNETRAATMEGWAFVEFLSLLMFYSLSRLLVDKDLLKDYTVKSLLFRAASITQVRVDGRWSVYNMTKKTKDIFEALGISVEPIS